VWVAEAKHLAEFRELLAGTARQSTPNQAREHGIPHPRSGRPGTYRLRPQATPGARSESSAFSPGSPDQREGLDLHQEIAGQLRYWGQAVRSMVKRFRDALLVDASSHHPVNADG
jgi:hypothetical protein